MVTFGASIFTAIQRTLTINKELIKVPVVLKNQLNHLQKFLADWHFNFADLLLPKALKENPEHGLLRPSYGIPPLSSFSMSVAGLARSQGYNPENGSVHQAHQKGELSLSALIGSFLQ